MAQQATVKVWDAFVRLFHWSLVAGVTVAGVTGFFVGGRAIDIHIWAGAAAVALVGLRVVWGFLGPGVARFSNFIKGPRTALAHVQRHDRHLGHNPLGGWMVLALILAVLALGLTGVLLLGGVFHVGPAKSLLTVSQATGVGEVHEVLAFAIVGLVLLHLGGVAFESLRGRENLARAMLTGRKPVRPGDPSLPSVRSHPLIAALIGAGGMLLAGALLAVMSDGPVPNAPVAMAGSTYAGQCADCHMAYHPSLLPAASWDRIMSTLDDHFGEDAWLPEDAVIEISGYLQRHSADSTDSKPAVLFRSNAALRITESAAWERIHDEVPEAWFESAAVRSEGNCAACHTDAATGWFYPGKIEIPERAQTTESELETDDDD